MFRKEMLSRLESRHCNGKQEERVNEWKGKMGRNVRSEDVMVFRPTRGVLNTLRLAKFRGQEVVPNVMARCRNKKLILRNAPDEIEL